jgi:hypothetical protein
MARRRAVRIAAAAVVLAVSGGGAARAAITAHAAAPAPTHAAAASRLRPGVMPVIGRGTGSARSAAAASLPPANAHLFYYGGPVISAVHVVEVLYGVPSTAPSTKVVYEPEVQRTTSPSIASFYSNVTQSTYLDWMSEYSTTGSPQGRSGTDQTIGRGTFDQQVIITPSAANDPFDPSNLVGPNKTPTIDDANIQDELQKQINAGSGFPQPTMSGRHILTLYAIYFPIGVHITITVQNPDGSPPTVLHSGRDFCAYHGTTSSPEAYYSVLPDFSTVPMPSGCENNPTEFQSVTGVSSHELAEAITDPEVGLVSDTIGFPLAWYDPQTNPLSNSPEPNGEAADICNGIDGTVTGADRVPYTVQKIWSNYQGACVLAPGPGLPRFAPHNVGAPQVAVTPDGSQQIVFWKDTTTNQLAEAWYALGSWHGPVGFPQLGTLTSTPAVAVSKDGSQQLVFWEGPGGHLLEAWYALASWHGPVDITNGSLGGHGILASAPSVVTTMDGSQLVFWRGTDGHLGEAWYAAGGWHGPSDFTTLGSLASAPSATITPDGSQQLVFFQGSNNLLSEDWYALGSWHGPMQFGAISSPPSVTVTPDGSTQLVFSKTAAGHLQESWYTLGSWHGPIDWTTSAFAGNGLLTSSPSATVTVDGSTQIVFWQGAASTLWEGWYTLGAWHGPVNWSAG